MVGRDDPTALGGVVDDPVDAAGAEVFFELAGEVLLLAVGGEVGAVLEEAVVHVHDVQGAIGGVVKVDGAEAFVGGGEELPGGVGVLGGEGGVGVFREDVALDEVGGGRGQSLDADSFERDENLARGRAIQRGRHFTTASTEPLVTGW